MDFKDIIGGLASAIGSADKKSTSTPDKTKSGKTIAKAGSKSTGSATGKTGGLDLGKGLEILQTLTKGVDLNDFKGLGDLSKIKGLDALKVLGSIKGLDALKMLGNIKGFEMLKGIANVKDLDKLKGVDSIANVDLGSMLQNLKK